ncbi:unnamed protein product [Brassica rapa subsp. trilocularis]
MIASEVSWFLHWFGLLSPVSMHASESGVEGIRSLSLTLRSDRDLYLLQASSRRFKSSSLRLRRIRFVDRKLNFSFVLPVLVALDYQLFGPFTIGGFSIGGLIKAYLHRLSKVLILSPHAICSISILDLF